MKKAAHHFSLIFLLLSINSCTHYTSKKSDSLKISNVTKNKKIIKFTKIKPHYPVKKPDDFWDKLLKTSSLHYKKHNKLYYQHYKWFQQHPNYIYQVLINAKPFLGYVYKIIEENNLPSELLFLPAIESNYDSYAYSYQGAAGIWQLMNLTAKRFDIEQNWWYEGRRDINDSTHAALNYLKFLFKEFDQNWLLAIAAYNAGEGTVKKAILKNKKQNLPTDFWNLDLPEQTTQYVPKWLALCDYIKTLLQNRPKNFPQIKNELDLLQLDSQIDLRLVAKLSRLPLEKIYFYNPAFNQWATAPDIKQQLLLPHKNLNFFKKEIQKIPKNKLVDWRIYTVNKGDNLGKIAEKFNITLKDILKYNKVRGLTIYPNEHLILPIPSAENTVYEKNMLNARKEPPMTIENIKHTVAPGDSLWKIAKQYHVSVAELCQWNQIKASNPIKPSDTINIIKKIKHIHNASIRPKVIRKIFYQVKPGESCALIAKKFQLPIKKMYEWNSTCNQHIYPKQKLKIFIDVTKQIA